MTLPALNRQPRWPAAWPIAGTFLALFLVSRVGGHARAASAGADSSAPPVQLVETVPVETKLGNPALPAARDVWGELIRGAKKSLDFEEFYLSTWPGEPMDDILEAIGQAAQRGVRVRLLLDAGMHETYPRTADSLGKVPGIAVRTIDMGRIAGGVQHAKFFIVDDDVVYLGSQNFDWRALEHIHELGARIRDPRVVRAFRPIFEMDWIAADSLGGSVRRDSMAAARSVVLERPDGSTATMTVRLGNPRATGADSARAPGRSAVLPPGPDPMRPPVRDVAARLGSDETGAPAKPLPGARTHSRDADLPYAIVQARGDTVELWPSYSPKSFIPDSARWDRNAIVRLLDSARREVVVQLLTYAPEDRGRRDDAIDAALRRAARRGAKVRLLVSDWEADRPAMHDLESLSAETNFEVRLSSVPEWSGGYIPFARVEHCKYAVVDSTWTWLGTSNWEPGYFHGSRNIAVTMRNRALALEARRVFETSWIAPSAIGVRPGAHYAPRVHGTTPPPGKRKYGE